MLKCSWCMKKLKDDKPSYGLNVKFVEGKKMTEAAGKIIHLHMESRNTSVPIIIPGIGSEADQKGIEGIFPICSDKCGEKMSAALVKEMGTIQKITSSIQMS